MAGRVTDIKVKPGDKVKVGAVVLVVEDGASANQVPSTRLKSEAQQDAKADSPKPKARKPKPRKPKPRKPKARSRGPRAEGRGAQDGGA